MRVITALPLRHRLFIDFTITADLAHAAVMAVQSFTHEGEHGHLRGDVVILFAVFGVLAALWLPMRKDRLDPPHMPPPPPAPEPSARRPGPGLVYAAGMSEDRVVEASKRLAAALRPGDLDQTLSNITAAAVEVLPDVQWSSLTIKHADGRLETVAPTADMLLELDAAQYELEEGPCYEAAVDTVHVVAPHLAADERFPRYAPVALRAGIRAQAGIRLFDGPDSNGALNLYSDKVGAFEDLGMLADLFAHQSAVALDYARRVDQLEEAVTNRQLIGQAVGIVMERFQVDDARAFGFLTRLSNQENLKLRLVAQRLLAAHRDSIGM